MKIRKPLLMGELKHYKKDGHFKWYYDEKQIGARCCWSINWLVDSKKTADRFGETISKPGIVKPVDWFPSGVMDSAAQFFELQDVVGKDIANISGEVARWLIAKSITPANCGDYPQAMRYIEQAREGYETAIWPLNPPANRPIGVLQWRLDWMPLDLGIVDMWGHKLRVPYPRGEKTL